MENITELVRQILKRDKLDLFLDVQDNSISCVKIITTMNISREQLMSSVTSLDNLYFIDYEAVITKKLLEEALNGLWKQFFKSIENAEEIKYENSFPTKIVIGSNRVLCCFKDNSDFVSEPFETQPFVRMIEKIGELRNTEVYCDHSISYSQTHVLGFDEVEPLRFSIEYNKEEADVSITYVIKINYILSDNKAYVCNVPEYILDRA